MSQLEAFVAGGIGIGGWVPMPISGEDFLKAATEIGLTNPGKDSLFVTEVEPNMEALRPHLQQPFDINELNYFAAKLEDLRDMSEERQNAFAACLQARRHCGSVSEMINLLENLDRIDLQPAFSPEQYGAFHIDLAQDEYSKEMDALENSDSPSKTGFADYISDLERCLDIKGYGKLIAQREGGVFTDFGYMIESAAFQELYRGVQDIPAEFQASPFRESQPLLKLEHTDLTDALAKIHDLGGYANDLDRNLETLHHRRSADFLLLLTGDKAVLSEAAHVYREGTAAHDAFVNAADAKMFSMYVTDFQTDFIGDIREVDASARRADILDNSIHFVDVKAVTLESKSVTFTPEEWKNVSAEERDSFPVSACGPPRTSVTSFTGSSFQSWTRQFVDGDFTKVRHHIEHQCDADDFWARTASLEEFFSKLAQDFPAKAERAPEPKQKSVLAQIAAARAERGTEPPKPIDTSKHRTEPER